MKFFKWEIIIVKEVPFIETFGVKRVPLQVKFSRALCKKKIFKSASKIEKIKLLIKAHEVSFKYPCGLKEAKNFIEVGE